MKKKKDNIQAVLKFLEGFKTETQKDSEILNLPKREDYSKFYAEWSKVSIRTKENNIIV